MNIINIKKRNNLENISMLTTLYVSTTIRSRIKGMTKKIDFEVIRNHS